MEAGSTMAQPTAKLAKSPTKAVEVPLSSSLITTFKNSHTTPATGPR